MKILGQMNDSKKQKQVAEFLKVYEELYPLISHPSYFDNWAEDALELWELQCPNDPEGEIILEAALDFRKEFHNASLIAKKAPVSKGWEWLLTANQVEQRTDEWYSESKNMITASEVANILKTVRSRASVIKSKLAEPNPFKRNAVKRCETGPMDWGVRYEPVAKQILEETLEAQIKDLGRIKHRTVPKIAASPDGLIITCKKDKNLVGRLVEIKCPPSRVISEKIPYDYWCQMQLQMEVCDIPACEFVEVKFEEEKDLPFTADGFISLEYRPDTCDTRYTYHKQSSYTSQESSWEVVETYGWKLTHLRRVTVLRDSNWFRETLCPVLEEFWKDVENARLGLWIPPPPLGKKDVPCAIVEAKESLDDNVG